MKTHEITTIKGDFIAVEIPDSQRYNLSRMAIKNDFYRLVCKLSEMTEEDASKVVDEYKWSKSFKAYYNYVGRQTFDTFTALNSFDTLLKSKGIDVNKGNWYLFKKI